MRKGSRGGAGSSVNLSVWACSLSPPTREGEGDREGAGSSANLSFWAGSLSPPAREGRTEGGRERGRKR